MFRKYSKDFTINNMKKNRIKTKCKYLSIDFNPIDTNNILDIHRHLMKKRNTKKCFELLKRMLIVF